MLKHKYISGLGLALLISLLVTGAALALLGDLNVDGVVDADDMDIIAGAYGSDNWGSGGPSPHWDWYADLNHDDFVDLEDLALAARNYGDDFNVHWRRRVSNGREGDPDRDSVNEQEMVIDSQGRRHIIWCDTTTNFQGGYLYYTQLDAAGNPLVRVKLNDKATESGGVLSKDEVTERYPTAWLR